MVNVLSIDWDYFIEATSRERGKMFPDGGNENLSEELRSVIWGAYYAQGDISRIGVDENQIQKMKQLIIMGVKDETKIAIVDSHKHIHQLLKATKFKSKTINLFNIDYHHDLFDKKKDIHCGNWLHHVMQYYSKDSKYTWIAREDSDFRHISDTCPELIIEKESFETMMGKEWDFIYICRSSMWSPPHLDKEFEKAFHWMQEIYQTNWEEDIFQDRYEKSVKKIGDDLRVQMSKLKHYGNSKSEGAKE